MHQLSLMYFVDSKPVEVVWPSLAKPYRTDGLWQTTCFELFLPMPDGGYVEFNFAPSSEWAAYRFASYRGGMEALGVDPPDILAWTDDGQPILKAVVRMPELPRTGIALSAVIEETDGTKSYWALRHPPGKPDFHHPDCFALELAAPDSA